MRQKPRRLSCYLLAATAEAASSFDKLRIRLNSVEDATKNLPHAELVEARRSVMQLIHTSTDVRQLD